MSRKEEKSPIKSKLSQKEDKKMETNDTHKFIKMTLKEQRDSVQASIEKLQKDIEKAKFSKIEGELKNIRAEVEALKKRKEALILAEFGSL
jgi:hypothetical protein